VIIVWPFLGAITWALTLAILFAPLHVRIERIVKHPNVAALLSASPDAALIGIYDWFQLAVE